MTYQVLLGVVATFIGFYSYIPYFRDIFKGTTKPHIFSWFVWGLLTSIGFFAQISKGGGAGSWVTGFTALMCFAVAVMALKKGEKDISRVDWLAFIGALCGIVLWWLTSNPLTAVIVITIVDALAYVPTFRKGYLRPHEETLQTFLLSAVKFAIGVAALQAFNLTTWLYPVSLVLMNGAFVAMLVIRRKQLKK